MKVYWDIPEEFTKDYADGSKEFIMRANRNIDTSMNYPFVEWCKHKIFHHEHNNKKLNIDVDIGENISIIPILSNNILESFVDQSRKTRIRFTPLVMTISALRTIIFMWMIIIIFQKYFIGTLILSLFNIVLLELQYASLSLYPNEYKIKKGTKLFKIVSNKEIIILPVNEYKN